MKNGHNIQNLYIFRLHLSSIRNLYSIWIEADTSFGKFKGILYWVDIIKWQILNVGLCEEDFKRRKSNDEEFQFFFRSRKLIRLWKLFEFPQFIAKDFQWNPAPSPPPPPKKVCIIHSPAPRTTTNTIQPHVSTVKQKCTHKHSTIDQKCECSAASHTIFPFVHRSVFVWNIVC